ncbi:MAG: hypothetical protein MUC36_18570 [Planctomycetes bacterium]|nr:hypothetical protein [Planctomycetota bacterium]
MNHRSFSVLVCRALLTSTLLLVEVVAQLGAPLRDPALPNGGHVVPVQAALQAAFGPAWMTALGIARTDDGHYFVSVARPSQGLQHLLVELDASGQVVGSWPQPAAAQASPFGLRDLAYDGVDTLFGGAEVALCGDVAFAFDVPSRSWAPARNWPVPASGLTTLRGLAIDPTALGGQGLLWVSDWDYWVLAYDRQGQLVRSEYLQTDGGTYSWPVTGMFGLAHDPQRNSLWVHSQGTVWFGLSLAFGGGRHCLEFDLGTMAMRRYFMSDQSTAVTGGTPFAGLAGGCEFFVENGTPTLLLLHQMAADTASKVGARFELASSCGGTIDFNGLAYTGMGVSVDLLQDPGQLGALFGDSSGSQLPTHLQLPIGPWAPGCTWHLASPNLISIAPLPGNAIFTLPNDLGLVGTRLDLQWASIDLSTGVMYTSQSGALGIY